MFKVGDKVKFWDGKQVGEVVKVLRNGKIKVAYWMQGGFMTEPELWKDTFKPEELEAS